MGFEPLQRISSLLLAFTSPCSAVHISSSFFFNVLFVARPSLVGQRPSSHHCPTPVSLAPPVTFLPFLFHFLVNAAVRSTWQGCFVIAQQPRSLQIIIDAASDKKKKKKKKKISCICGVPNSPCLLV